MNAWYTWRLEELPPGQEQVMLGVGVAVGLLYCFAGYRLFRLILGMTGFLLAGTTAVILTAWLSSGHLLSMGIALLVGGLCGSVAMLFLYRLGVFLMGGLGGMVIAHQILQGRPEWWIVWAVAGSALGGGLVALLLEPAVMTLATSAIGSLLAVGSGFFLALGSRFEAQLSSPDHADAVGWGLFGAWAVLGILGSATQFSLRSKGKK